MRLLWLLALGVALPLTVPIALVGCCAGVLVAGCERWLVFVGRLAGKVGWWSR